MILNGLPLPPSTLPGAWARVPVAPAASRYIYGRPTAPCQTPPPISVLSAERQRNTEKEEAEQRTAEKKGKGRMAAEVSSIARMLRGEAGKGGRAGAGKAPEMVTMDLLGGCGGDAGGEDEVVDLEVKVPAGWERRLDLLSGKTFLTPHRHQAAQDGHQDLNLPPTASTAPAAAVTTCAAVCTLDMVRDALQRAAAARSARSPDTSSSSSASTSSSSPSLGKRSRSPPSSTASPAANPAMRAAACPSCLTYVLIAEADPRCPRCASKVPPLPGKPASSSSGKKPKIDLNAVADETE
ncbi:hypothetical protein ZWY2020_013140 [Hordeum vulgare]|nr:hypothetical protein ZWY2020_013140 [Hordeum vulgare]